MDEGIDLPSALESAKGPAASKLHDPHPASPRRAPDNDSPSPAGPGDPADPPEADEADLDEPLDPRQDESNMGQYSPEPLSSSQIYGQDVVSEQEDRRMLDLLRAQVLLASCHHV